MHVDNIEALTGHAFDYLVIGGGSAGAAVAAAFPYSKHWAVTRAEASASCSALRHRPATMMFSPRSGTSALNGTS